MDANKETMSSRHNRTSTHMNLQGLLHHAEDLHRFKLDGVPILREGSANDILSLTKEQSSTENHIQIEISFLQQNLTEYTDHV